MSFHKQVLVTTCVIKIIPINRKSCFESRWSGSFRDTGKEDNYDVHSAAKSISNVPPAPYVTIIDHMHIELTFSM